jgi:hypothetical protein
VARLPPPPAASSVAAELSRSVASWIDEKVEEREELGPEGSAQGNARIVFVKTYDM